MTVHKNTAFPQWGGVSKRVQGRGCSTAFPFLSSPSHYPKPKLDFSSLSRGRPNVRSSNSWGNEWARREIAPRCGCFLAIPSSMFLFAPCRVPPMHPPGFELSSVATENSSHLFRLPSSFPFQTARLRKNSRPVHAHVQHFHVQMHTPANPGSPPFYSIEK